MTSATEGKNQNIQYLRGVAILLVAIFHFTNRWQDFYPWGKYVGAPWFFILTHGVQLFFIISGYVIYESLNRTESLSKFIFKRLNRLVVPLILIAPLLYLFQIFFPTKVFSEVNPGQIITSILIINPTYLLFFFKINSDFITGVQWTLTYEITFYVLLSLVFFKLSKKMAFEVMFWLTNLVLIANYTYLFLNNQIGNGYYVKDIQLPSVEYVIQQSGLLHLSWFLLGMWFFKFTEDSHGKLKYFYLINLLFLCAWDIVQGRAALNQLEQTFLSLVMFALFVFSFFYIKRQNFKTYFPYFSRGLELLGNVSYEFYLIHEILGVTFLVYLSKINFISSNPFIYPVLVCLVIFIIYEISNKIYYNFSIPIQKWLKKTLQL